MKKRSRNRELIRNLFLIAALCTGLWYLPRTVEYNRILNEVGVEREALTAEYVWKCKGYSDILYIEAWLERESEQDDEVEWIWLQLQKTFPLNYYGHASEIEVANNMVSWIMNDRTMVNQDGNRYHVWDKVSTFPPLPRGSMICMTDLAAENMWQIDIDCLEPDYEWFAKTNGGMEHFVPELTYTMNKETGVIEWIHIDQRCEEMRMVPKQDVLETVTKEMEFHWQNYFVLAE